MTGARLVLATLGYAAACLAVGVVVSAVVDLALLASLDLLPSAR